MQVRDYQKINNKIALLSTFALLILLALITAKLIQQFLQKEVIIKPFAHELTNQKKSNSALNLPKNLFGNLNLPNQKVHKRVKKTRLNLTLIGVLNQQEHSLAIIKQHNIAKIYKINDAINSSAKVKEIYSKYIILDHNGNDEKLSIKYKKRKETASLSKKSGKKIVAKKTVELPPKIKRLSKLKLRAIISSPKKMLSAVSIEPSYKNDNLHGFVIHPSTERTLFKEIGLQSGDVILSINDIKLNSWFKLVALRKELSKQHFDLVIERKKRKHFLSINLN